MKSELLILIFPEAGRHPTVPVLRSLGMLPF
jgi:hypothetical protein